MEKTGKIGIGSDHAGYELKHIVIEMLKQEGYDTKDFGTYTPDSVDYPDYVHPLADEIEEGNVSTGILICGSANGVAMTANKHQKVRAAIAWREEVASLAREHNNANVLCIPSRFVSDELGKKLVHIFLTTPFGGGRHERRVSKIALP